MDGGFFEKFGSLLRQKSIHDEEKMATPLAPLPEVAEEAVAEEAVALEARLLGEEGENDSGNETLHDTDSEPEDAEVKSLEFVEDAVGWNVSRISLFIVLPLNLRSKSRSFIHISRWHITENLRVFWTDKKLFKADLSSEKLLH